MKEHQVQEKTSMIVMRPFIFFGALALLWLGVVTDARAQVTGELVEPDVMLLIDSSASMGIADPRERPEDRARAAIAAGTLAPDAGLASAPAIRDAAKMSFEQVKQWANSA